MNGTIAEPGGGPWTILFRSVTMAEYESIRQQGRFVNPTGIEHKYFALTLSGAEAYAGLAASTFGEGPFIIVKTTIRTSFLRKSDMIVVDGGIETVVLDSASLLRLTEAVFWLRVE